VLEQNFAAIVVPGDAALVLVDKVPAG